MTKNTGDPLNGGRIFMKRKNENYISSQQSPRSSLKHDYKYKESMYSHMFLEDFCISFSFEFSSINKDNDFYDVRPANDNLKKYLLFENYSFFRYDFEKILDSSMYSLILGGKSYIEIVTWKDSEGCIKGISFIPLGATNAKEHKEEVLFTSILYNGEKTKYKIKKKNVIALDLKEIGFQRNYFRRLINKMAAIELPSASMLENGQKIGFDFREYNKRNELKLLQFNKKTHWLGRNYSNQHLSESYLLYRTAHYKMLRLTILDYFLKKFNDALKRFQGECSFEGKIVATFQRINYEEHLEALRKGEINTSQFRDIIYPKYI